MKAKHAKQHNSEVYVNEDLDDWGDRCWVVEGKKFKDKAEALKVAQELMEEEFRKRYIK